MKVIQRLVRKLDRFAIAIALKLLGLYRLVLSPLIGNQCRFYPSCSRYSEEAYIRHGFIKGTYLTAARLIKCHPWHQGGIDPVPQEKSLSCRHSHSHSTHGNN